MSNSEFKKMIITLANTKGGVGKSTICVNLAAAIAGTGRSVGVIDTDPQKSSVSWGQIREMLDVEPRIEVIHVSGSITDTIKAMRVRHDVVLIDTAGFDDDISIGPALVNSDVVICPFAPKHYDLEVKARLYNHHLFASAEEICGKKLRIYALLNRCPTNAKDKRADDAFQELKDEGFDMLKSRLGNREAFGDATQTGNGVTEDEAPKAAEEINALMEEVLQ